MNIKIHIYLGFSKFAKARLKEIYDAIYCSWMVINNSKGKENNQHSISEQNLKVNHLQSTVR